MLGEIDKVVWEAGGGVVERVGKGPSVPPRRRVGGAKAGTAAEPPHGAKQARQARDAKFIKGKPAGAPLRDRLGRSSVAGGEAEHACGGGLGGAHAAEIEERSARKRIVPEVKNPLERKLLSLVKIGGERTKLSEVPKRGERPRIVQFDAKRRSHARGAKGERAGAPLRHSLGPQGGGGPRANSEAKVHAEGGDDEVAPARHEAGKKAGILLSEHGAEAGAEWYENRLLRVKG
jgi:hypothetical protein